ncbi:MAG TPA: hypothetical protein VLQ45_17060 [Thermoanaerobaculia bacterium]|nr:hypothetical protein [Thermoanaerobaculia bacterium]
MIRKTGWFATLLALGLGLTGEARAQQLITDVDVTAKPPDSSRLTGDPKVIGQVAARTSVLKTGVCREEVFAVEVDASHPSGTGWVTVTIDGYPADHRYLQLHGEPGMRRVNVSASTEDGQIETRTLEIPVLDCELTGEPRVRSRFNPYHPYTVDFVIENAEAVEPWFKNGYHWDFGDGAVAVTPYPYASHSYAHRINGSVPYQTYTATVSNEPGQWGPAEVSRGYTVTLQNNYYHAKKRGIVQPITTSSRMERRGGHLVGTYSLRNPEAVPVIFQSALIEERFCDPNRSANAAPVLPSQVIYQGARPASNPVITGRKSPDLDEAEKIRLSLPGLPADAVVIPPRSNPEDPSPLDLEALDAFFPQGEPPAQGAGSVPVVTVPPAPGASGVVVVPGKHNHEGFITLDAVRISEAVCGVGYHLKGVTADGLPVYASFYFAVKENPSLKSRLTDPAMKAFLKEILRLGMVPGGTRVTQEDLYRLEQQGRIRRTVNGWEVL